MHIPVLQLPIYARLSVIQILYLLPRPGHQQIVHSSACTSFVQPTHLQLSKAYRISCYAYMLKSSADNGHLCLFLLLIKHD